jgi:hypothetical protein
VGKLLSVLPQRKFSLCLLFNQAVGTDSINNRMITERGSICGIRIGTETEVVGIREKNCWCHCLPQIPYGLTSDRKPGRRGGKAVTDGVCYGMNHNEQLMFIKISHF